MAYAYQNWFWGKFRSNAQALVCRPADEQRTQSYLEHALRHRGASGLLTIPHNNKTSFLSLIKAAQTSSFNTFTRPCIRRIDTTTLYHLTAMLWYHVKHEVIFVTYQVTPSTGKPLQKHPIFWLQLDMSEIELDDPNFLLHTSEQLAMMKLSTKFKNLSAADSELSKIFKYLRWL